MKILQYPDEILTQKSIQIDTFDQELKNLSTKMFQTMLLNQGVGLAAPQVGILKRLIVIDTRHSKKAGSSGIRVALVNPEIVETSNDIIKHIEGCLSFRNKFKLTERPRWAKVKFQDLNGEFKTIKFTGISAQCVQHEIDHLNGFVLEDYGMAWR